MAAFKNKDNGTWYVQFRYTDWKGERQQKLKRGFATKREALEWEREFLMEKQADVNMTFESFVALYEKDIKPKLKLNTWRTKESIIQKKILPFSASLCPPSPAFGSKKDRGAEAVGFLCSAAYTSTKSFPHFPHGFPRKKPFFCMKRASYVENPSVVSRCISTFPHMAGLWIFRPFSRRKCGKLEEKHVVFQTKLLQNIFQCGKIAAFHLAERIDVPRPARAGSHPASAVPRRGQVQHGRGDGPRVVVPNEEVQPAGIVLHLACRYACSCAAESRRFSSTSVRTTSSASRYSRAVCRCVRSSHSPSRGTSP